MPTPLQLEYQRGRSFRDRVMPTLLLLLHVLPGRRFWIILSSTLAVVCVMGFLSNRLSYGRCERRTAVGVVNTYLGGGAVHLNKREDADSRAIFTSAGITILPSPPPGIRSYPYAGVSRARSIAPFVVEVEYGWTTGPLCGEGHVRRFLCLFGYIIETRDDMTWVS